MRLEELHDVLYGYLTSGTYLSGVNPSEYYINKKTSLWRTAINCREHNGSCFILVGKHSHEVIKDKGERRQILESCHVESGVIAYRYAALH